MLRTLTAAAAVSVLSAPAVAQNGTWTLNGNGSWETAGNWSGGTVANGAGSTAFFTNSIPDVTGVRTVSVNVSRTIGGLQFSDGGAYGDLWNVSIASGVTLTVNTSYVINTITDAQFIGAGTFAAPSGFSKYGAGNLYLGGAGANSFGVSAGTDINAGAVILSKAAGTTALGGAILVQGGSLIWSGANQLADTSTVTMTSGELYFLSDAFSALTLNGGTVSGGTGTTVTLTATGTALTLRNVSTPAAVGFKLGGSVRYDGNGGTLTGGTINGAVDLNGGTRTATIDDGTSTYDLTLAGVVSNGGLTKAGAGALRLSGGTANTYTGPTTVSAGTLYLGKTAGVNAVGGSVTVQGGSLLWLAANQVPDTAAVTLTSGSMNPLTDTFSALTLNGGQFIGTGGQTLTLTSTGTALTLRNVLTPSSPAFKLSGGVRYDSNSGTLAGGSVDGAIDLTGGTRTFTVDNGTSSYDLELGGVISNGGLTKAGAGTLLLYGTAANTYTGLTTVSAGTLALGKSTGVNAIGGDLTVSGGTVTTAADQLPSTATVTLTSGSLSLTAETTGRLILTSGTFSPSGATNTLTSTAPYALVVNDNRTLGNFALALTGGSGGGLQFNGSGGASSSGAVNLGGVTREVNVSSAAGAVTLSGVIGNGGITKTGAGNLLLNGTAANTYTGTTTVSAGTLTLGKTAGVNAVGGAVTVSSGGTLALGAANQIPDAATVTVNAGGAFNLNGFSETVGSLAGAGTVGNSQAGVVTLTTGGTNGDAYFSGFINNGITLQKVGTGTLYLQDQLMTYTGGTVVGGGSLYVITTAGIAGNVAVASGAAFGFDRQGNQSFAGAISGAGRFVLGGGGLGAGAFVHTQSGDNTYAGGTYVTSGRTLQVGHASALGNAANLTSVGSGSGLDLNGYSVGIGALTGGGTVTNTSAAAATLTLGNGNGSDTFSGTIGQTGGALSLTKVGTGTQTLSGMAANTFTGTTAVLAGTLVLNKTGVDAVAGSLLMSGGTVRLAAANQIGSSSTVTFGGGTFSTGAMVGFSDAVGTLDLNANSTLDLGTGRHDLTFAGIAAAPTGTLLITGWSDDGTGRGAGGRVQFTLTDANPNQSYADFLSHVQYDGLPAGQAYFVGSTGSYELVPAPVPEPATVLYLTAAGLGLATAVRRHVRH